MSEHIDPVCEMTVDEETSAGSYDYEGKTYYFCSESCIKRFKSDPEFFLKPRNADVKIPLHKDRKPTGIIKTVVLPVEGMSCASCVLKLEKSLSNLNGVSLANVNFGTEKAIVKYDPGLLDMDDFKAAVESAGAYKLIQTEGENGNDKEEEIRHKAFNTLKLKFIFSFLIAIITMTLGMREMIPVFNKIPSVYDTLINYTMLILTTPVLFWGGEQFFRGAYAEAKHFSSNMDTLIALGTSVAYAYSAFVTFFPASAGSQRYVYFDTTAWIIALILLGRLLEAYSKGKTTGAIKALMALKPKTARLIRDNQDIEVLVDKVNMDDLLRVKPGDSIPVDGVIVDGSSTVDESMLTGESMPVEKNKDAAVFAGTINTSGSFVMKTSKIGTDTALSQIIRMVSEAQGSKAPIERLADKISSYFVPVVISMSILTGISWYVLSSQNSISLALTNLISVLIIACPCALGLATPTAVMVGIGKGAQQGILIKGGDRLEKAYNISTVIFDKTGTLTQGKPVVTDVVPVGIDEYTLLSYTLSIESLSEHPLAQAVVRYANDRGVQPKRVDDFKSQSGIGVSGIMEDRLISIKKPSDDTGKELAVQGKTVVILEINKKLAGIIALQDIAKNDAYEAISELKASGIKVAMITGDNFHTAYSIAQKLGIDDLKAGILPEDKASAVKIYQQNGSRVAMVGDGINDAPALTSADIGIAVGSGTDIAIEASDITIVGGELSQVHKAIKLANATMRTIKQNLFWALIYNTIAIPIAAGVLYPFFHVLLNPAIAALAMAFSSVSVVLNSLRLRSKTID